MYSSLIVQEARSPKSRPRQGWFLLESADGETVPCLSPDLCWCWYPLACRHVTVTSATHSLPSPGLLVHVCALASYKNTSHWIWDISKSYFQSRSHSEILDGYEQGTLFDELLGDTKKGELPWLPTLNLGSSNILWVSEQENEPLAMEIP